MVAVPTATPDTLPVPKTVAILGALLVQLPPPTEELNVVDAPVQTVDAPDTVPALGKANTRNARVAVAVPQVLVTK